MQVLQDMANLITVRMFLNNSIDNLNVKLSREMIKSIQTRVAYLDQMIVEHSLKMNLDNVGKEVICRTFTSTEDTETVLKNLMKDEPKATTPVKSKKGNKVSRVSDAEDFASE